MATKGVRRAGSKHSRARALRSRGSVRAPPTGIHKLGAMDERLGTDIYIPLKGERGRVLMVAKSLFKRMYEGDDELGTRDLVRILKGLSFDDPRRREIAVTVNIQRLLQSREVIVEYDRTAETVEITGPEGPAKEVGDWFDKHWKNLVFLMDVEDEGLDETPIFPITGF
jgi:hypothetical protein